jgi:hypothetical protein
MEAPQFLHRKSRLLAVWSTEVAESGFAADNSQKTAIGVPLQARSQPRLGRFGRVAARGRTELLRAVPARGRDHRTGRLVLKPLL